MLSTPGPDPVPAAGETGLSYRTAPVLDFESWFGVALYPFNGQSQSAPVTLRQSARS
jgi:hypothetical protein